MLTIRNTDIEPRSFRLVSIEYSKKRRNREMINISPNIYSHN